VIFVLFATILCGATIFVVRDAVLAGQRLPLVGFDGVGVLVGFVIFTLGTVALGSAFALSLIASLLLHEFGHVTAFRMLGHHGARFRLVPLLNRQPVSDQPLRNQGDAFFVALMGPAISIAPMVLAYTLSMMLAARHPDIAAQFRVFAVTCASLNFVFLLPFWPLDGGRCTRIFASTFWPNLAPALTVFMAAAFAAAAIRTGSVALMILAGVGAQSMFHSPESKLEPLRSDVAMTAMSAYAFTLAAHFTGGWLLLSQYL